MKKVLLFSACALLVMSSCGSYTGMGAYTGSSIGSILGSAIGGITGGYRGSDVGTIVGLAGGALVGSAIGNAADRKQEERVHQHYNQVQQRKQMEQDNSYNSGYSNRNYDYNNDYAYNGGDDRIYDFGSNDYTGNYSASPAYNRSPGASSIERYHEGYDVNNQILIRNPRFVDDNHDNVLRSNELCKVIFEVVNTSSQTLYDVQPTVVEASANKRIYISPNVHVERLGPGEAIRYTAMVKAGKLKDGQATFCISALQGDKVMSNVSEFTVTTRR